MTMIPIISYSSTEVDDEELEKLRVHKIDDFLVKPANPI